MITTILLAIGCWCWDPVTTHDSGAPIDPPVDGYYMYWSATPTAWRCPDKINVTVNQVTECDEADAEAFCTRWDVHEPAPGEIIYVNITAYRGSNESEPDHGPVEPCP